MLPDALPAPTGAPAPPELDGLGPRWRPAATAAWAHAPFLRAAMRAGPAVLAQLDAHGPDAVLADASALVADGTRPVAERLRMARARVALATALADIAGVWPLERVTRALSDFADAALDAAVAAAITERVPGAGPEGFVALALGKLGSHELNYSSDVDLILLFDPARLACRAREDPAEAAVRVGRRVVELMQARTAHGYVARIDLRLRPSSEVTPIAIPVEAALSYYQSEALPWERAAFIRARACAGDGALGRAFLEGVAPFVWRRHLDFAAIDEVRAISLRIRDHHDGGQTPGPGYDLKLGRGGIREIEFYAQAHQLVFGGRDPALRAPATLDALAALVAAGRIGAGDADTLARAYRWLRAAEHRAQMVADAQTHRVPAADDERETYARFSGYADWAAMGVDLSAVTAPVSAIYATVADAPAARAPPRDPDALGRWLGGLGLTAGADDGARLVAGWTSGTYRALRGDAARRALDAALPDILPALFAGDDPRAALARLDRFLQRLPQGAGFLTLIAANPPLAALLGRLLSAAPALADAIARQPALFDTLLDPDGPGGADALTAELARLAAGARDAEDRLDRVRRFTGERRFGIGAALIEGRLDPLDAAGEYAALADAGLAVLARAETDSIEAAHGRVPGARLIVLALGRYGGGRLTARSDLDLVFLRSDGGAVSDGARPLGVDVLFHRLASRLTAALSVTTAAGALYTVDTRLRPSGADGPLVVGLQAFARYQRDEAWTFEHMALTRARVVWADAGDREAAEAVIGATLRLERDPARLHADVLAMRGQMDRHRPGGGALDVKQGAGGLIDLEFLVQYRQLGTHRHLTPRFRDALAGFVADGALPSGLTGAHALLTRALVAGRLVFEPTHGPLPEPPRAALALLARSCGQKDAPALRAALAGAKRTVAAAWEAVFQQPRTPDA